MKNARCEINRVISEFCENSGLGRISYGQNGIYTITYDGTVDLTICLVDHVNVVVVYSYVGTIDEKANEEDALLLEQLLHAHFFWAETNGFSFALDGNRVMLTDRRPYWFFVDGAHLGAYMESCLNLVKQWRIRLLAAGGKVDEPIEDGMVANPVNADDRLAFLMDKWISV